MIGWQTLVVTLAGVTLAGVAIKRVLQRSSAPVAPVCSREFSAFNHGGPRALSSLRLVVLHATDPDGIAEPTARQTAEWFAQKIPGCGKGGPCSTHVVVGPDGCYRTLADDVIAYGAGEPANAIGLHVEQAGHSNWTRAQWLAHQDTIARAAAQAAAWCDAYAIPVRFVLAEELRALQAKSWPPGSGGITDHLELSRAFPHATDHRDPGVDYPLDVFMRLAGGSIDEGA